jgi:hypothetical protein
LRRPTARFPTGEKRQHNESDRVRTRHRRRRFRSPPAAAGGMKATCASTEIAARLPGRLLRWQIAGETFFAMPPTCAVEIHVGDYDQRVTFHPSFLSSCRPYGPTGRKRSADCGVSGQRKIQPERGWHYSERRARRPTTSGSTWRLGHTRSPWAADCRRCRFGCKAIFVCRSTWTRPIDRHAPRGGFSCEGRNCDVRHHSTEAISGEIAPARC